MPLPPYIEVVNITDKPVVVRDLGLAATGGTIEVPPFKAGDAASTLPRNVWHRKHRRHQGELYEFDKAQRLGLLPAEKAKPKKKGDSNA